jgi:hypothetical protein
MVLIQNYRCIYQVETTSAQTPPAGKSEALAQFSPAPEVFHTSGCPGSKSGGERERDKYNTSNTSEPNIE